MPPSPPESGTTVIGSSSRRSVLAGLVLGWALLGVFAVRTAVLGRAGDDVRAYQVAYLLGYAGYLMLLWLVMRPAARGMWGDWRWWVGGCVLLRIILVGVVPSDDTYRYVWEGRVQRAGLNPFAYAPDDPALQDLRTGIWARINHPDYPAIYPPVAQLEFRLAAALYPSIYTLKVMHIAWDALTVLVLGACLRRLGQPPHRAIAYGLCPLVLSSFAVGGHVDSLMILFGALTLWAMMARRHNLAGVALGLAIATKLVWIVILPWFVVRYWRAALVAIVLVGLSYLPYADAGWQLFESLRRFTAASAFFSLLGTLRLTDFATPTARLTVAIAAGVVLVALAMRRRSLVRYSEGAMTVLLAAMPVAHYWYFAWPMVLAPFAIRMRWIAAGAAMIAYFEAERHRAVHGVWSMPTWAPWVVWSAWGVTWAIEAVVHWRKHEASDAPGH